jgi:hypothetical protein
MECRGLAIPYGYGYWRMGREERSRMEGRGNTSTLKYIPIHSTYIII